MDNDAARVIRDITNTPIYVPEGKGEIDVCEAVKDMIEESRLEGMENGRLLGLKEGELTAKKETAISLMNMGMPIEQIAQVIRMPVEVAKGWIEESMAAIK